MAWPTFTAGPPAVTAAQLNELAKHGNVWTTYTPTLTASTTNPTGMTYTGSGYIQAGKLVIFRAVITLGAAMGTGVYSAALPVTGKLSDVMADGILVRVGTGYYPITAIMTTTVASIFVDPTTAGAVIRQVSPTVPYTLVTGDKIVIEGVYEAA